MKDVMDIIETKFINYDEWLCNYDFAKKKMFSVTRSQAEQNIIIRLKNFPFLFGPNWISFILNFLLIRLQLRVRMINVSNCWSVCPCSRTALNEWIYTTVILNWWKLLFVWKICLGLLNLTWAYIDSARFIFAIVLVTEVDYSVCWRLRQKRSLLKQLGSLRPMFWTCLIRRYGKAV